MPGLNSVTDSDTLDSFIQLNKTVVVMFSAPWCGPCKAIKPTVEKMAKESGSTTFVYVNVEDFKDEKNKYKRFVQALPTFFIYRQGLINDKFSGANIQKLQAVA